MNRVFTCILCPNGCEIEVDYEGTTLHSVSGNLCPKGKEYVTQELVCPKRNIATSVLVEGGELPLVSVRLTAPIPRKEIFHVVEEIRRQCLTAPVYAGTVILPNVLGLGADVIATKTIARARGLAGITESKT